MYSPPIIPTENSLSSKVDLFISCRKLKNMDVFSKSDPVCRVYEWTEKNKQWTRIGATERISNNLNPDFKTTIQALYFFERNQKFKFEVVDANAKQTLNENYTVNCPSYCYTTIPFLKQSH